MIGQCQYCKKEFKKLSIHLKGCKFNDGSLKVKNEWRVDEDLPFELIKYVKFSSMKEEKKIKQFSQEALERGDRIIEKLLHPLILTRNL